MDTNDLRAAFTVLSLLTFLGILWWAYGGHRKEAFDEAALLPFSEDEPTATDEVARRQP